MIKHKEIYPIYPDEEFKILDKKIINYINKELIISNYGRIFTRSNTYKDIFESEFSKSSYRRGTPELRIRLNNNSSMTIKVAKLVLLVFVEYREDFLTCDPVFVDGNPENLYYKNLGWYNCAETIAKALEYYPGPEAYEIQSYKDKSPYASNVIEFWTPVLRRVYPDIPEFRIWVSSFGRIWDFKLNSFISYSQNKRGYRKSKLPSIYPYTNNDAWIHRLVMQSFCYFPTCTDKKTWQVDHINHINVWDNRLINLRWCTSYENTHYYIDTGEKNLYNDDIINSIFDIAKLGYSDDYISKILKIPKSTVKCIRSARYNRIIDFCKENNIKPIYHHTCAKGDGIYIPYQSLKEK